MLARRARTPRCIACGEQLTVLNKVPFRLAGRELFYSCRAHQLVVTNAVTLAGTLVGEAARVAMKHYAPRFVRAVRKLARVGAKALG